LTREKGPIMFSIPAGEPVPIRIEANGDARVGKTRVLLDMIVRAFERGATPETIVQMYDTLELADVYTVLGYYLRHRRDVEEYLQERERRAEEVRAKVEARQPDLKDIRERLLARREAAQANHAEAGNR
jgi:uncharacterized protein (DUF433 family)